MQYSKELTLFTDGSVNTKTGVGFGAQLCLQDIDNCDLPDVKIKRFDYTSSTRLELQTLLWALETIDALRPIKVYTDSQNIIDLPSRRQRLERNQYCSAAGKLLNNADLYQQFFCELDKRNVEIVKIKGHKPSGQKNNYDHLFSRVDRAARFACKHGSNI